MPFQALTKLARIRPAHLRAANPSVVCIRGAVPVEANTAEAISAATLELCHAIDRANWGALQSSCIAMWITATPDLDASFPAAAVRLSKVAPSAALMCAQEMDVVGAMPSVIRIMALLCPPAGSERYVDIYLRETAQLIEKENT